MECDCLADSVCTATSTQCPHGTTYFHSLFPELWVNLSSVLTAVLAVLGYAVYRLSQALPALIRWPIRLFCTLTGLSSLWSGVSHLVGTICGILKFVMWSSKIWRFFAVWLLYAKRCVKSALTLPQNPTRVDADHSYSSSSATSDTTTHSLVGQAPGPWLCMALSVDDPGLRLLLLGPSGGGRTQLADAILNWSGGGSSTSSGPLTESVQRRALVEGREVSVVDTPDLLAGSSASGLRGAREALRSLQLCSPGPHALLLVVRAPGATGRADQDAALAARRTLALFGEGVAGHIFVVLTHADLLAPGRTLAALLGADPGGLRTALSLCGLRAELVDNGVDCPPEARRRMCKRLLDRLEEMRALGGHFIHELQAREERMKEQLLADMSSELAGKLGSL